MALPLVVILLMDGLWGAFPWWATRSSRRSRRQANLPLRLLVKEGDGILWRTMRGCLLVGYANMQKEVVAGVWGKPARAGKGAFGDEWAIILTAKQRLVVYQFGERQEDLKAGTIQSYASWPELEAAVPPAIFQQAMLAAGITKPRPIPGAAA
jgi:hypothetical protein